MFFVKATSFPLLFSSYSGKNTKDLRPSPYKIGKNNDDVR